MTLVKKIVALPPNVVHTSDRSCIDCQGEVEGFIVVDKVWKALGLTTYDWICVDCFARRLNPDKPATTIEELRQQIVWKRRRFGLKQNNIYGGGFIPEPILLHLNVSFILATSDKVRMLTADELNSDEKLEWGLVML